MGSKLVLIGGGGHCKSVLDAAMRMKTFEKIVITDQVIPVGTSILGCEVMGTDDILPQLNSEGFQNAFITVGSIKDTSARHRVYDRANSIGLLFPAITDASATIASDLECSEGVFIGKDVIINAGVKIERFAIVNTGAIVEHDCQIGEFVHVAVGAVICGGCEIGNDAFIGANATVIQGVKVGMNSIIGAGSVVLADVPDNMTVTGVWGGQIPASKIAKVTHLGRNARCAA